MSTQPIAARSQIVVGLAGHIDHGKSSLVHALTGARVDRLPEEKRRGITIELGFSHFDADGRRFALVDVPGHERFIHTMVAGASGIDLAILVVAADDSVMPQTREHLAVLELLGVHRGVIAVTKCDLVDDEQLGLVDLEIDELTAATFLDGAPRVRTSAQAGRGIQELRKALAEGARATPGGRSADGPFRLPIDRAFSPAGQGTVVTGTVRSGTARVGDTLSLLPAAAEVRIRRLQSQGADVERVTAGDRAALNVAGIKVAAVHRGDELATPGAFEPGVRHLVELHVLADASQGLRHRQFVRLHIGAGQATAQLLIEGGEIAPGTRAPAVLRTKTPITAEYGQRFVVRRLSPAATLGGGKILAPALRPADKFGRCLEAAPGLASDDPQTRLAAYVQLRREAAVDEAVESRIGLSREACEAAARRLVERGELVRTAGAPALYVSGARFRELKELLVRRCRIELERRKPTTTVPLSAVLAAMGRGASPPVLEALVDEMAARREIVRRGDKIGLPGGAELSNRQRQMLEKLLAECAAAGPAPPTLKEFGEKYAIGPKDLDPLVQVAVDEGRLVRLSPTMCIDPEAIEALRLRLVEHFASHATAKVGELREQWGITRKHAVPIFEFFDRCRITVRDADVRSAGPRAKVPVAEVDV